MRDRGASMAEYALLVGLIAIVALTAVSRLGDSSSGKLSEVADKVDSHPLDQGSNPGPTPTVPTPSVPVTPTSTTTTTIPTATTSTTTTTTTTIPTLDPAYPSTSGFTPPAIDDRGQTWSVSSGLVLRRTDGRTLSGTTATVRVWRKQMLGSYSYWLNETVTVTTRGDGTVNVVTDAFTATGSYRISEIRLELISVDHASWDGVTSSVTATL
jgi:Flp pilus assembly pilin Flp